MKKPKKSSSAVRAAKTTTRRVGKSTTKPAKKPASKVAAGPWTFLTNYSHVLICLDRDPQIRLREVAERVGITERAVQRIVQELEEGGVIVRTKEGRRNVYALKTERPLRHPLEAHRTVGDLLALVNEG